MHFQNASDVHEPSLLLRLPVELRRHIYQYVLPTTEHFDVRTQNIPRGRRGNELSLTYVREQGGIGTWKMLKTLSRSDRESGGDILWRRGSIGILATNRQIHEECVDMIYGESVFVIDVAFDSIKFRFRWLVPSSNLMPSRAISFMEHFSQRNLLRIKNYVVNIEHVDNYTGMIKYNYGGKGLTAGIIRQVHNLVDLLAEVPYLNRLQVHLIDGAISRERFPYGRVHRVHDEKNYLESEKVLDPFKRLCSVRKAQVTGVSAECSAELERTMACTRGNPL
ncbi:hypothetical protein CC78DRAFT_533691 [Lojkania enalia]|uniref:DUF7730 domain-containing protein n=1 Tax=Lojkania enalia TaxID=147567 RepID=A0A9P4K6W1_9PLEO|nr:hypothetical protein CC78DRAFT_533691 [Didymosphaeria enalia]